LGRVRLGDLCRSLHAVAFHARKVEDGAGVSSATASSTSPRHLAGSALFGNLHAPPWQLPLNQIEAAASKCAKNGLRHPEARARQLRDEQQSGGYPTPAYRLDRPSSQMSPPPCLSGSLYPNIMFKVGRHTLAPLDRGSHINFLVDLARRYWRIRSQTRD
jgi:hypothetical protein